MLLSLAVWLPINVWPAHQDRPFASASIDARSAANSTQPWRAMRGQPSNVAVSCQLRFLLARSGLPADAAVLLRDALVTGHASQEGAKTRALFAKKVPSLPRPRPDLTRRIFGTSANLEEGNASGSRLARLTTYWPEEGDHYTKRGLSSTGVRLRDGHCAVDPAVIPYGSVVTIPGLGMFVAVDTGPAVISRRAARRFGRNPRERNALVVDIFCSTHSKANAVEASAPEFAVITWYR